jgi:hypothetical protein
MEVPMVFTKKCSFALALFTSLMAAHAFAYCKSHHKHEKKKEQRQRTQQKQFERCVRENQWFENPTYDNRNSNAR